ncbi:MAG TPA: NAD(P)/FAD-dependent oxidoreductase [Candidatus Nanoarchaeia archaeon]|nr:NAD(P)/FAD-dependent oxidoreductase [Candidatus Nanoarchaeia archaeon]
MKKIVIIGGGFGGIYTAKHLIKKLKDEAHITLIDKKNYFLFSPMLHEVATGGLNRSHIVQPIRAILRGKNFDFMKCNVNSIDFKKKEVTSEKGKINYDYLVIAIGAKPNFYGIPGAEEYSIPLKENSDAGRIKSKVIECFELAEKTKDQKLRKKLLTFVIVGAGPTGVELAGELAEFTHQNLKSNYNDLQVHDAKIFLLQKGDKIIPMMDSRSIEKAMRRLNDKRVIVKLNCGVNKVTKEGVALDCNEFIETSTIIWTGGVKPNTLSLNLKIIDEKGHLHVDEYLQVRNASNAYALGDCAFSVNPDGKQVPALAQAAVKQAKVVADNLIADVKGGEKKKFRFKSSGLLVSIGQRFAVANIHGIDFSGFFAWWLWRTIYLSKLVGFANKFRVAYDWTLRLFSARDTTQLEEVN